MEFLKNNNPLYSDIVIAVDQIPPELITPHCENIAQDQIDDISSIDKDDFEEEDDNPLDDLRVSSAKTILKSTIPFSVEEENVVTATGENKKPLSVLMDQYCKECAFPYLLPRGHFGYNVERDTHLSASK